MTLTLRKNNRPQGPGSYLCKRPHQPRPEVTLVRDDGKGGLTMLHGIGIFPLAHCENDALWSDALEIVITD